MSPHMREMTMPPRGQHFWVDTQVYPYILKKRVIYLKRTISGLIRKLLVSPAEKLGVLLCLAIVSLLLYVPASGASGVNNGGENDGGIFGINTFLIGEKHPDKNKPHDKEDEEPPPSYEPYLKNPSELGFAPDSKMFKSTYVFLKTRYVKPVEDSTLVAGCNREVGRLLEAAKIKGSSFKISSIDDVEKEIEKFNGQVKKELLFFAAIRGMLEGLDDPYTVIMTPKEYSTLMEQMQSMTFGGIGIFIELDKEHNDTLTIFEPIEGTPAQKAGLQPQDAIMFINGESTKGMKLDVAVSKMRGPIGSKVTLSIKRSGVTGLKNYTLMRAEIKVNSISCKVISGKYGYIKIRTFGEETGEELTKALARLAEKNIKGIILDLRNNGGGYIDAAVQVSSKFVNNGAIVVSVTERNGMNKSYYSEGSQRVSLPLLVLVNKYSASASEITAGALQDHKVGPIMGTKTFGKGSVQQIFPLKEGGALKVTTAHYYTPKGRDIDKHGISPDITVEMEPKLVGRRDDAQLLRAVKYFDEKLSKSSN